MPFERRDNEIELRRIVGQGLELVFYGSKVLKIAETCKGKIAASEDFALAETFFALAESLLTLQICPFTHFRPQFKYFRHRQPPTK